MEMQKDLASKLTKLAKATNRSEKFYVTQALENYFENFADIKN